MLSAVVETTQLVQEATQTASESGADQSVVILVTGFVVVFMVLLLLIGIIKIYSGIVCAAQNKTKKKTAPETKVSEVVSDSIPSDTADEGIDLQTIAVITAAVEAYYSKDKKVRVKGIRHSQNAQSAWAAAGLYENIPAMRSEGLL